MKNPLLIFSILALVSLACPTAQAQNKKAQIEQTNQGTQIGTAPNQNLGFWGAASGTQPAGTNQAALAVSYASGTYTFSNNPAPMVFASGTLTLVVQPTANDTVILGTGTYNLVPALSGTTTTQVVIGPTLNATIQNLLGAINYWSSAGQANGVTYYIANGGTTGNASAIADTGTLTNGIVAHAIATGTAGNAVASGGSLTSGSNVWSSGSLSGGVEGDTAILGTGTYIFSAYVQRPTIPNLVLVGATLVQTIQNFNDAFNGTYSGSFGGPPEYSAATATNPIATMTISGDTAIATAQLSGTANNLTALGKSGSNISVSGTSMSGGTQFSDANAEASLINAMRAALVKEGLLKGSQ